MENPDIQANDLDWTSFQAKFLKTKKPSFYQYDERDSDRLSEKKIDTDSECELEAGEIIESPPKYSYSWNKPSNIQITETNKTISNCHPSFINLLDPRLVRTYSSEEVGRSWNQYNSFTQSDSNFRQCTRTNREIYLPKAIQTTSQYEDEIRERGRTKCEKDYFR